MVSYLQPLGGCQSLCLLALNTPYQHSCQRWAVQCWKHCQSCCWEPHFQQGNQYQWKVSKRVHCKGTCCSGYLTFQSVPLFEGRHPVWLTTHKRDCPFQDEMRGSYVLSLPPTAMAAHYEVGLTLCGVDCSGQESDQPGKPGLVLKLSICFSMRETVKQAAE